MTKRQYRDLIRRAARALDGMQLDLLAAQLADAERAREILRAKGYGAGGMTASAVAALVPDAVRLNGIKYDSPEFWSAKLAAHNEMRESLVSSLVAIETAKTTSRSI